MSLLFETVRSLVVQERYVVGVHAAERLDQRKLVEWQIAESLAYGELLLERPEALPNPAIEVRQQLADGTEVKVVWSLAVREQVVKLVTVHFLDD